jgi:restriction endonuclease S subunit
MLGDLLEECDQRLGTKQEPEILTLTEGRGFVSQKERFRKRLANEDTSNYKLIGLNDIAFNPYLLWAGAIAQNTTWERAIISPAYPTFRVRRNYNARFVNYLLCGGFLASHFDAISFGSVPRKRRSTVKDFLELRIAPQPPLAEQERLVKMLDEANALRKLRAQADRRTADLIPALFQEMFGRHINSTAITVSLDNLVAPQGWRWARLTGMARLATGHTPSRRIPEYWNGDIPWISLTDIRELDGLIAGDTSQSVTQAGIDNSSAVKLPRGTVCFSRTASVGFVTVMGREMCTSQDFVNWVCGPELNRFFLMGALIQAREYLRSLASGSTHRTIYFPTVEQFCTLVPPLHLQNEFAERVGAIWALQAEQEKSRRRLDDLFQSMLHNAFSGQL